MSYRVAWFLPLALALFWMGCDEASGPAEDFPSYSLGGFQDEQDLGDDHVLGGHHHVMLRLESSGTHPGDTGDEGVDRLRYLWPTRTEHTFCLLDENGAGHTARLLDSNENVVVTLDAHGDCQTLVVAAGLYWLEIHHGRRGESGQDDVIWIRPDAQVPEPVPASEESESDRAARLMDACVPTTSGDCALVASGSLDSWASDYIGQPKEGEVIIYSDEHSKQITNEQSSKNQSGPSKRALKFNGRCDYLGMTNVNFDDSLVGIVVGPNTGIWLYHDSRLGGARNFYYENKTFYNDILLPARTVSSLWAMTIAKNNTYSVISSGSCISCDLHGVNLSDLNLANKDLHGANLKGSRLERSDLTGANLSGCDLRNTRFTDAILTNANLSGSHLNGAIFTHTNLKGADLSYTFMNRDDVNNYAAATFTDSYMANVNLSFADCTRTVFTGVHFFADNGTATASKTNFSGARFSKAVLYRVNFDQATINGTSFDESNLVNASMKNVAQESNSVYGAASFYKALLAGTDFSGSTLPLTDMSSAQLSRKPHDLTFAVMINPKQAENRQYTAAATIRPTLTEGSVCPDRGDAPCNCVNAPPASGCTTEGRWTNPEPLEIVGDKDPDEW